MESTIPSIPETNPEYSIKNIFKPTPKSTLVKGMMFKIISIGLIGLGGTLLAMVSIVAGLSHTLLGVGIVLNIVGLLGGAYGEGIILLSGEQPISSLFRAAEEIKSNPTSVTIQSLPQILDNAQTSTNLTDSTQDANIPNN